MNLRFFGGANEVGASSTEIKIDGYRILVDAGIRMNHEHKNDSRLPDFPDFDKVGMPDAVLLTHAHTDHTGALPLLRNLWIAGVKIYWTPATKAITRVLLEDGAKLNQREEQEEGKSPLYTPDDVEVVLHCMEKEVPWLKPVPICGDVTATWIPAGHILGAAMIYIQGKHESILMTGDVSATPQSTIPGMDVPSWCRLPDVMVMESTYGNRPHEGSRKQEAKRLAEDVAKVVAEGGKVLIPVFAVGRSQEVVLILKRAMELREIPKFPVYVDGMVQKINDIYSDFVDELSKPLRRRAERDEKLFYSDTIRPIRSDEERNGILSGKPCCIIASSGMLIGGRSAQYAEHLARDLKNLIAITGYQAEGTSGRALWDLVEAGMPTDQKWQLKDQEPVGVKCQVKKYSLSAHADGTELMELVEKVDPRKLFLVHGDEGNRKGLEESIQEQLPRVNVILPENGEVHRMEKRKGIAGGRQGWSDGIVSEVVAFIRKMGLKGPFRVEELAEIWFGTEAITPVVVRFFEWCLSLEGQFFEPGTGNVFHLRQIV